MNKARWYKASEINLNIKFTIGKFNIIINFWVEGKMIKFSKILQSFATTTVLKPPIPLKKPQIPANSMSPSMLAQKLNIS